MSYHGIIGYYPIVVETHRHMSYTRNKQQGQQTLAHNSVLITTDDGNETLGLLITNISIFFSIRIR